MLSKNGIFVSAAPAAPRSIALAPWRWIALETGRPPRVKSEAIAKHVDPKVELTEKTLASEGGAGLGIRAES